MNGMMPTPTDKIRSRHRDRLALVYVRQSTLQQVERHQESTRLQYGLVERALELGWPRERVEIIDDDLGRSGTSAEGRLGFQRLVAEVGLGRVGLVLGVEMSRLARSCCDWLRQNDTLHRLGKPAHRERHRPRLQSRQAPTDRKKAWRRDAHFSYRDSCKLDLRLALIPSVDATFGQSEQDDVIFLVLSGHAGRTTWHTGYGKTLSLGALGEQPLDRFRRNVTLDQISANLGGVTGRQLKRNAKPRPDAIDR